MDFLGRRSVKKSKYSKTWTWSKFSCQTGSAKWNSNGKGVVIRGVKAVGGRIVDPVVGAEPGVAGKAFLGVAEGWGRFGGGGFLPRLLKPRLFSASFLPQKESFCFILQNVTEAVGTETAAHVFLINDCVYSWKEVKTGLGYIWYLPKRWGYSEYRMCSERD